MKKRLAHKMEIEKPDSFGKPCGQGVEFIHRHCVSCACRLGAEHTVEVTNICYFKVASCNHVVKLVGICVFTK